MTTWHVDSTWAERFLRGELPVDEVVDVSAHIGGCQPCMRTLSAAGERSRRPNSVYVGKGRPTTRAQVDSLPEFRGGLRWDAILQSEELVSPVGLAWGEDPSAQSRWEEGQAVASEFCALDDSAQVAALDRPSVYCHRGFAEVLLASCEHGWVHDPLQSLDQASLALRVGLVLRRRRRFHRGASDLVTLAWAFVANCQRILSRYAKAHVSFRQAEAPLLSGTGDPRLRGRVLALEAGYLKAHRQFDRSEALYRRILGIVRQSGDVVWEAKTLMSLAGGLMNKHDYPTALSCLQKARLLLSDRKNPFESAMVDYNLAQTLGWLGQVSDSQGTLEQAERGFAFTDSRPIGLRIEWVQAVLALKKSSLGRAENSYRRVRRGFLHLGDRRLAAFLSMELSECLLGAERKAEAAEEAATALPILVNLGLTSDSQRALALLRRAQTLRVSVGGAKKPNGGA